MSPKMSLTLQSPANRDAVFSCLNLNTPHNMSKAKCSKLKHYLNFTKSKKTCSRYNTRLGYFFCNTIL